MSKNYDYSKEDVYKFEQLRHKIDDPRWQNHYLIKPKKKVYSSQTQINLGKHENHSWQPIKGPFGPHAGKIVCNTCGGKWVAWLPKGSI